jgi:hypothetical protein
MSSNQSRQIQSERSGNVTSGKQKLRQNPFTTYRDPQTGQWVVVKSAT